MRAVATLLTALASASCTSASETLEALVASHEATISLHEDTIARMEARLRELEQAVFRCCGGGGDPQDRQEGLVTRRGLLQSPGSLTTSINHESIRTTSVNVTDLYALNVHVNGAFLWHGRIWSPNEPTAAPTAAPTTAPTEAPTPARPTTCKELREGGATASGIYVIYPDGAEKNVYCDHTTDGGGWRMVWKHSYYEVASLSDDMRFFSQVDNSATCTSVTNGWCNTPGKLTLGAKEQMTAAYYNGALMYAWKGTINSNLDSSWEGAILNSPTQLVEDCSSSVNSIPEPNSPAAGHAIAGLTFNKANDFNYVNNCDSDRYGSSGASISGDCRWENCRPSAVGGSHKQMTIAIFVR